MNWDNSAVGLVWLTVAILAGGYARTRNRSAWTWFLLTLFLGPIAAFLLVTWPARQPARPGPDVFEPVTASSAGEPRR
jgi:uncharacterized membrane protein